MSRKKPAYMKKVEGTYRKDRDGPTETNPDGLQNFDTVPYAKKWMSKRAKKHWREHAKAFHRMGRLTPVDVPLLRAYCVEIARYETAVEKMNKNLPIQVFRNDDGSVKHAQVSPLQTIAKQSLKNAEKLASKLGITIVDRQETIPENGFENPYQTGRRKDF